MNTYKPKKSYLAFSSSKRNWPGSGPDPSFDRLSWSFGQPPKQFELIQRCPEIFYCLPAFVNRRWKEAALDHTILWRPEPGDEINYNAWYGNPAAHTPYKALSTNPTALRWGQLYERLVACRAGIRLPGSRSLTTYLQSVRTLIRQLSPETEPQLQEPGYAEGSPLYLLAIVVTLPGSRGQ
jgi:hypothetical protein